MLLRLQLDIEFFVRKVKQGKAIQDKINDLVTTQDITFEELKSEARPKKPRKTTKN